MSDRNQEEEGAKGNGAGVEDSDHSGCQQGPEPIGASKGGWCMTLWRKGGWFKSRAAKKSRKTAVHQCYMRLVGPDGESEAIPTLHVGDKFIVPADVLERWLDATGDSTDWGGGVGG